MDYVFLTHSVVTANSFLFAGTVPANSLLFAGTVLANSFLFAGTVPVNNPGNTIKISHLQDDTQEELTKIFDQYSTAFARDAFDCGKSIGLVVHLDVQEG